MSNLKIPKIFCSIMYFGTDVKSCLNIYIELTLQIFKRFDFKNQIFRKLHLISSENIINQKASSILDLAMLFPNLISNALIQLLDLDYREILNLNFKSLLDQVPNTEIFWKLV